MDPVEEAVIQDEMFEHRNYPEVDLENLLDDMDLEAALSAQTVTDEPSSPAEPPAHAFINQG